MTRAYCLYCKTGSERVIAQHLSQMDKTLTALAPIKQIPEKRQGFWQYKEQALLPGYVFLYTAADPLPPLRTMVNNLYRVLSYETGVKELSGQDELYAQWIYRHHGQIEPSAVLVEGGKIRVISGPLLDFEGKIIKLDKHKRRAWVSFEFDGQGRTICIGAESLMISAPES
jgi:transcription antitermination factor NusG